jgi:CubicO group peptidase (beta-lactamase class C family)
VGRSGTTATLLLAVAAVLCPPCLHTALAASPPVTAEQARQRLVAVDEVVLDGMERFSVPGLSLAVVADGQVVLAKGYGYRNLDLRLPMTADTELPIASATKPFTAFLVTLLAADGVVDWHTPVQHYLPSFATDRPATTAKATPRDLITHRTGVPRHDAVWADSSLSRRELFARLPFLKSNTGLRQRFQYNNLMYVAAGVMLEEVTGQTWEELVHARVLSPLGMTRTSTTLQVLEKAADHSLPYRLIDGTPRQIDFHDVSAMGPASGLNSTASDLTRWLLVNADRGKLDGRQIVPEDALLEMFEPVAATGITPEHHEVSGPAYGLGWFLEAYRHHLRVFHGGNIDGFTSAVSVLPGDGIGVVVLTNLSNTNLPDALCRTIADRLLGLDAVDWVGMAFNRQLKQEATRAAIRKTLHSRHAVGTKPRHALDEYVGEYSDPGYGLLSISLKGDHLEASFAGVRSPLEHLQYDTFLAPTSPSGDKLADQRFAFSDDAAGEVTGVALPLEPAVEPIAFRRQVPRRLSDPSFLARLAGTYSHRDGTLEITLSGSALTLHQAGRPPIPLSPTPRGDFVASTLTHLTVRFAVPGEGSARSITIFEAASVRLAERSETATPERPTSSPTSLPRATTR